MFHVFFFFKQKTAYEMRISDWSSDVCSSDLCRRCGHRACGRWGRCRSSDVSPACAARGPDASRHRGFSESVAHHLGDWAALSVSVEAQAAWGERVVAETRLA